MKLFIKIGIGVIVFLIIRNTITLRHKNKSFTVKTKSKDSKKVTVIIAETGELFKTDIKKAKELQSQNKKSLNYLIFQ